MCDDENKKEEVPHEATAIADMSDAAGGRVAEKSTVSADAEMTETEEQKQEASWTSAGRTRKIVAQAADETKPKNVYGYVQIWAENAAAVKEALDELGATQTTPMREWEWRWCHILHPHKKMGTVGSAGLR